MANYELMVIYKPQLMAEDTKTPVTNLEKLIKQASGKILSSDDWGEKNLTYPIAGHDRGYYVVYQLELDEEKLKSFGIKMNLNKDVLRWLQVSTDGEEVVKTKPEVLTSDKKPRK